MPAQRLIELKGDARTRGRQLGEKTAAVLREILATQFEGWPAARIQQRQARAKQQLSFIKDHAPRTLEEMLGLAEGAGLDFDAVLLRATGYDAALFEQSASACTAFVATGAATANGQLIGAQNNDEGAADGRGDFVALHLPSDDEPTAVIYSHPGVPAYMGMNDRGLCLLWNYIDNGERGDGLTTCVLIRELLRRASVSDALDFLRRTPRAVPNHFFLADPAEGLASVEYSSSWVSIRRSRDWLVHANHIVNDDAMSPRDRQPDMNCSRCKHDRMTQLVLAAHGRIDPHAAQRILRDRQGPPNAILVRPEDNGGAWASVASLVMLPRESRVLVAFGPGEDEPFVEFTLPPAISQPRTPT